MNILQAKNEIKNTVQAYLSKNSFGEYEIESKNQRPLLLIGPPGIGKTQIMEQISKECQIGLVSYTITHHTRQSAVGLPFIQEKEFQGKTYSITEYTMSEIIASVYSKMEETGLKEGILFIDEINCVSETLAPTMLQFLQNKTFGNQKVPSGWIIVAAGNPSEYNKSVRDFDVVTMDRIRYIHVETDYYVWKEYAISKHIHPMILSYLELKPNNFYTVSTSVDGMEFVTARGWEDLSYLLYTYEKMHLEISQDTIYEYLHHEDIAEDVFAYYLVYKKYQDDYGIDDILNGNVSSSIYARLFNADFDERVSVVNLVMDGLLRQVNIYSFEKHCTDLWFGFLKNYRNHMDVSYVDHVKEFIALYHDKLQAELLSDAQKHEYEFVLEQIQKVNVDASLDSKSRFDCSTKPFFKQKENMESIESDLKLQIENAFEFMESAFKNGQEMTIFVTNLTMSAEMALYLSSHTIGIYEKYKQVLLIGSQKARLLDELAH
ncbi:ATP-binding protein [Holdemanella biformis]|uniref:ATP-binding protein n=1 Tax=Holdemanella biformis TaxID=1735 RepID=UPI0022E3158E|nr:AAA family ATPase [Holdemanella biformis]